MSKLGNLRRITPFIICFAAFAIPVPVFAHARLLRSLPASGAHVASISVLRLWFSERPVVRLTSVTLHDQNGASFSLSTPQAAIDDQTQILVSTVVALPAGHYTVDWRTMASDGHPSHGQFSFTVLGEPQVSTRPEAQPTSVASGTP